ncbi:MAG TPA: septum site-determining protein MinC [Oculatellaceae cyanobacterium]
MSKIAIISQPDQGVLIDVSGCTTLREAIDHLTSTLQVSSQFWKGTSIALNLGQLELNSTQVAQVLAITKGVGAFPKQVFSKNGITRTGLRDHGVTVASGEPIGLPEIDVDALTEHEVVQDEIVEDSSPLEPRATIAYEHDTVVEEAKDIQDPGSDESTAQAVTETSQSIQIPPTPAVLYLRQNLRSGQTVSHKGHLVIVGDVNPGAEIMAEGDITVWGVLRGIAHAGIGGNLDAEIRALKLQPIQIRIGHAIARSPDRHTVKFASGVKFTPETARIVDGKIKISCSSLD